MSPAEAVRYQFEQTDLLRIIWLKARRQTCRIEDAEDLRQTTALVALERADSLRDVDCARPWIWGIYDRLLMDYIEKRVKARDRTDPWTVMNYVPCSINIEQEMINADSLEKSRLRLQGQLLRLKPNERMVLTQFYGLGRPKDEIRAEMHLTETQFRLLKHRSKARLAANCRKEDQRI